MEKPGKGMASLDDGMLELERILDRLEENSMALEESAAADRAVLLGELERAFKGLVRCAKEMRGSAEGKAEVELVEARIAVLESFRKLAAASFKKETGTDLTWH